MAKKSTAVPEFTLERSCCHCRNAAPHKVVHRYANLRDHYDESVGEFGVGIVYLMIECPACRNITLLREHWHTGIDETQPQDVDVAHPSQPKVTEGLPEKIRTAIDAADRVKTADPNAYGVLVRRGLELVCRDRGASGRNLHDALRDLGAKGEIPERLTRVALGLKNLGNVGAHALLGDLSPREVPLMSALFEAVLEYVYGAPHLLEVVEKRMQELKAGRSDKESAANKDSA